MSGSQYSIKNFPMKIGRISKSLLSSDKHRNIHGKSKKFRYFVMKFYLLFKIQVIKKIVF